MISIGHALNTALLNFVWQGALDAPGWSMDRLAEFLGTIDSRPVVNRTGLEGEYRIMLNFTIAGPAFNADPPPNAGPDIRVALEEQMGLKLEPAKIPLEYVVIDHIEKPSSN